MSDAFAKMTGDSFVDVVFHEVVDISAHVSSNMLADKGIDML